MARQIAEGDTAFSLAQELLGDGNLYHELEIPMWSGDPDALPVGQHVTTKYERPGPPAKWAADPRQLAKGR